MSPTQLTFRVLDRWGVQYQKVEYWNGFSRRRVDLFGCIDIVACASKIAGIQVTTLNCRGERLKKITGSPLIAKWLGSGAFMELWCWRKLKEKGKKRTKWIADVTRFGLDDGAVVETSRWDVPLN